MTFIVWFAITSSTIAVCVTIFCHVLEHVSALEELAQGRTLQDIFWIMIHGHDPEHVFQVLQTISTSEHTDSIDGYVV